MLTVIHDVALVTVDKERRIIPRGAIAIEDDRITAITEGEALPAAFEKADHRINGLGMVAIPGLVNAHTHMTQALQRGLSDDLELLSFLKELAYPVSQAISPAHVGVGAKLSCIEALHSGTTCIVDNITGEIDQESVDLTARAMTSSGIRGLIAVSLAERTPRCDKWQVPDFAYTRPMREQLSLVEKLVKRWHGTAHGRIRICPAPVTTWANSPGVFRQAHRLAEQYDLLLHTHVAETESEVEASREDYGQREVEWLHSLGVLGPRFMIVHGVWLSDEEITLIAQDHASVVHCPTSNMSLASGVARVPLLRRARVAVALGSDGIGNHNHDMFSVMKAASLLHKVAQSDPTVSSAEEVLEMVTLGGARALRMEDEIGSLEVGKKADLALVRLDGSHLIPIHRLTSALVYGANGKDVDTVMVDGQVVLEGGRLMTLNENRVLEEATESARDLVRLARLQHLVERSSNWGRDKNGQ
jgi:5-methylthioadenosine/S-adenosylhomocysteine deaminase